MNYSNSLVADIEDMFKRINDLRTELWTRASAVFETGWKRQIHDDFRFLPHALSLCDNISEQSKTQPHAPDTYFYSGDGMMIEVLYK